MLEFEPEFLAPPHPATQLFPPPISSTWAVAIFLLSALSLLPTAHVPTDL
jgi:hypothetical protein